MKRTANRRLRQTSRNLKLESLESREMLTSISPWWPVESSFAIRNDAVDRRVDISHQNRQFIDDRWQRLETITAVTQPTNGSVSIGEDGVSLLLSGDSQTVGRDSFTYTYETDTGEVVTKTGYLNFVAPLTAVNDWRRATDSSIDFEITSNDQSFNSSQTVLISAVSETSAGGTVTISSDGESINYTPLAGFEGLDTFTYTAVDEFGATDTATVTVDVTPNADPNFFATQEEFESFILDRMLNDHRYQFGNNSWYYGDHLYFAEFDSLALTDTLQVREASNSIPIPVAVSNNAVSETNVQVAGVDEGDLVKTDGDFLYQLSNRTEDSQRVHELVIIDVRNADFPSVARRVSFDGPLVEQYLIGDRLTVIWADHEESPNQHWRIRPSVALAAGTENTTMVSVFDVSDPLDIHLVEETEIDGKHFDSRAIDDTVYVVTSADLQPYIPLERSCADEELNTGCFNETAAEFLIRTESVISDLAMPSFTATDENGNESTGSLVDITQISITEAESHWNLTSIVSFDVDGAVIGPEESSSYVTVGATELFVSTSAIYLAEKTHGRDEDLGWYQNTDIRKLEFDQYGYGVTETASGSIPGWLDNSFSMDEHNGYLRITAMRNWGSGANLYVLQHTGTSLDIVGQIEDMAPGERIYATRFAGDRGYVVTFRQIDPLFVIDLSDPTNPVVTGELKVPGFSNYLQPIGENHLIGIGRNADETSGFFEELQVSLFDVSDPTDPTLVDRYSFEGGRELWTPVAPNQNTLGDHHAVTYVSEYNLLALPIYTESSWFGWGWDPIHKDGSPQTENGIRMLSVDLETGFEKVGNIDFEDRAQRSVRIGSYLYGISSSQVRVVELEAPEQVVYELYVGMGATDDHVATKQQGPVTIDVFENDNVGEDEFQVTLASPPAVGSASVSSDGQSIVFDPPEDFFGRVTMEYDISGELLGRSRALVELVYQWEWHNTETDTDINADGSTSANDVLVLVNLLNEKVMGDVEDLERQELPRTPIGRHHPDANNDGRLNVSDALKVVNAINAKQKYLSAATSDVGNRLANEGQGELLTEQVKPEACLPVTDPRKVDSALDDMALETPTPAGFSDELLDEIVASN